MKRWAVRLAMLVASVMFVLVPTGAANASAFCDSEKVPAPQMPGLVSSFLDPGPPQHTNPAWSTDGTGGFVYERYGYPPALSTFDTGCANLDPSGGMDVTFGNGTAGVATTLVALSNATHRFASGSGWLGNFDALLQTVSEKVSASTYLPFVGLALTALAIFLIWEARRKRLAPVVQHVAWALLVMTFAATVMSWPLLASQTVDQVTATTVGSINSGMVGEDPNATDPAAARESLVTDKVLYQHWLAKNFGTTQALTDKDGPKLLDARTYSRDEAAQIRANPSAEGTIDDGKKVEFQEVAKDAEDAGGSAAKHGQAYLLLQGKAGNHWGAGALAIVAAICILPFLLMSDMLVVISLLVVRLAVMAFPAIAVPGVTPWGRPMVKRVGSLVGGAMFNAIVFSFAAALDVLVVSAILGPDSMLAPWVGLLLSAVLGVVLWKMLKPHRQLAATFGSHVSPQAKKGRSLAKRAAATAVGGAIGGEVVERHIEHRAEEKEAKANEDAPRPESFTRPPRDEVWDAFDRSSRDGDTPPKPSGRPTQPKDESMPHQFPAAVSPASRKPASLPASGDGNYAYPSTDADKPALPTPDAVGNYAYPMHGEAKAGRVPNALGSREQREPVEIYTPPPREPYVFAHEAPSHDPVLWPVVTSPTNPSGESA